MRTLLALGVVLGLGLVGCSRSGGSSPPPAEPEPLGLSGRWVGSGSLDGIALVLSGVHGARAEGTYERREEGADAWVDSGEALAEAQGGALVRFWFGSGGVLRWVEGERDATDPDVVVGPEAAWRLTRTPPPAVITSADATSHRGR